MNLFQIVFGLILGGFIWFLLALVFEDFAMKRIREKKFGIGSSDRLSKEDKQQFYIPLAILSGALGIVVAYLGSKGLLPSGM
jgi:hypothetical protein